jgi:hypothetical protein
MNRQGLFQFYLNIFIANDSSFPCSSYQNVVLHSQRAESLKFRRTLTSHESVCHINSKLFSVSKQNIMSVMTAIFPVLPQGFTQHSRHYTHTYTLTLIYSDLLKPFSNITFCEGSRLLYNNDAQSSERPSTFRMNLSSQSSGLKSKTSFA